MPRSISGKVIVIQVFEISARTATKESVEERVKNLLPNVYTSDMFKNAKDNICNLD
jgi:AICAR transformylase/IMP cyclohydrolase PurH